MTYRAYRLQELPWGYPFDPQRRLLKHALKLYLAQVASGIVLGPALLQRVLHAHQHPVVHTLVTVLYWSVVAVLSLGMLTTLYHLSVPARLP